jgi:LysM repeat protein
MPDFGLMRRLAVVSLTLLSALMFCAIASAQSFPGNDKTEKMLEALNKKVDEQNAKIDTLSQQILKLEQQLSKNNRPGVIIGETPSPSPAPSQPTTTTATTEVVKPAPQSGNSHVVAKGETLTSIAKMHRVTVEELQKFNHIENDRKLQIGQTIMIPPAASSPSASPNG